MSRRDVMSALSESGLPVAHLCWPKGSAPELPWVTFRLDYDNYFNADNERYYENPKWRVELYQRIPDPLMEEALEEAISSAFGTYQKESEDYLETENCYVFAYSFNETDRRSNGQG